MSNSFVALGTKSTPNSPGGLLPDVRQLFPLLDKIFGASLQNIGVDLTGIWNEARERMRTGGILTLEELREFLYEVRVSILTTCTFFGILLTHNCLTRPILNILRNISPLYTSALIEQYVHPRWHWKMNL